MSSRAPSAADAAAFQDGSPAFLASLLAHTTDAVVATDLQLRVTEFAGAAERLYGCMRAAALGQPWIGLAARTLPPDAIEALTRLMTDGTTGRLDVSLTRVDDAWRDLDLTVTPVRDAGAEQTGWLVLAHDVTNDRALAALRNRERQMDGAFHALAEGVILLAADTRIVACNPAAEQALGLTRAQMEGLTPTDPSWNCVHEDGSPYPGETHPSMVALRTGVAVRGAVMGVARPDGGFAWLKVNAIPLPHDGAAGASPVAVTFSDISPEIESERREREARQRLTHVLEGSTDGYWDWHIPSGRVAFSARWCDMLGYAPSEVSPHVSAWEHMVHPDDESRVTAALEAHLRGDVSVYESEHRVRHRDGHWVWVLDRGKVVERGADGSPIRAAGTHTDINQRRQAEQALAERERQLSAFFHSPGVGMACSSLDGRFEQVNAHMCAMLGYTEDELLARTWMEVSHPDDLRFHEAPLRSIEAGELDAFTIDKRYVRKDGSVTWALTSMSCSRGPDGRVDHRVAIITDINARKDAERRLHESEARLRSVMQALSEAVSLTDLRTGRLALVNRRYAEIAGLGDHELVDVEATEVLARVHPDDRAAKEARLQQAMAGEDTGEPLDYRCLVGDAYRWFAETQTLVKDAAGTTIGVVAVKRDITERQRTGEAIRRELADSHARVHALQHRTLAEFLPICMYCKQVGDDDGQWRTLEDYISAHTSSLFSHGLCPDCLAKFISEHKIP